MKGTMKRKSLNSIAKASVKSRRIATVAFCFFIILSFVLVFSAIGIVVPLSENIETKINNHVLNREVNIIFSEKFTREKIDADLAEIKALDSVADVYEMPAKVSVTEVNRVLSSEFSLSWLHKYYTPEIIDGRAYDETESGVALIPAVFEEYDHTQGMILEREGSDFLGKVLELEDFSGAVREFQIVGTYDTTDPIFTGKELLIPRAELMEISNELTQLENSPFSSDEYYVVVADNPQNTQDLYAQLENKVTCYTSNLNVDIDSFNTALVIVSGATVFFVILTVFGFYIFLKGNIRSRTKELALLRAIGYKTRHLFQILLSEYMFFTVVSLGVGVGVAYLLAYFVVNPYLDSMFGGTFMAMIINMPPLHLGVIIVGYLIITLSVCAGVVRRTQKIDLTVLLRE